ncbi:M12 family metallopeptidase [Terrimonas sp. NA20]|uniref:M12 family metallopeptidase n=1 Tax=Terrimonas ginsenosidimutans TaxID=2908004 RepID=A0ABS9KUH4_9BACT|nr:M12 family metallopeptidase [Terrimonas ginsenosidimutans]MCG2615968.1 M12 family metallopeptidase [Terrimonas ginsenosidimutans]
MRIVIFLMLLFAAGISQAQHGYSQIKVKLPMSPAEKTYYVKKVMNKLVLNDDIIVGDVGATVRIFQSTNTDGGYIWPKGDVPVKIDLSMKNETTERGSNLYSNAVKAIDLLNAETNLRLVAYKGQRDYIRIMFSPEKGFGGLSPVGRRGGEQIVYITRYSTTQTIVHELLHSLGFWHEQNRPDRDQYISIDTNKVKPEFRYAFQIEPGITNTPYDYNSVMHYNQYSFAIDPNAPVMKCKRNNKEEDCDLGSLYFELSEKDIAGVNTAYWFNKDVARRNYAESLGMDDAPSRKLTNRVSLPASDQNGGAKPLVNGVYMIKETATLKYLDIKDISKSDGAVLQQWDKVGGANQQFAVQEIGNGVYTLKAMHSDKFLTVKDQSKLEEAKILQAAYNGQDNQKFYIQYNQANKAYRIKGLQSDKQWFIRSQDNGDQFFQTSGATAYFIFERIGDLPKIQSTSDVKIRTGSNIKKMSGN